MTLELAIFVYLFSIIFVMMILNHAGFKVWASAVLALSSGLLLLITMKAPTDINPWVESEAVSAVYTLIVIGTPVLVVGYSLISAFHDRKS